MVNRMAQYLIQWEIVKYILRISQTRREAGTESHGSGNGSKDRRVA